MEKLFQTLSLGVLLRQILSGVIFIVAYYHTKGDGIGTICTQVKASSTAYGVMALTAGNLIYAFHRAAINPFIEKARHYIIRRNWRNVASIVIFGSILSFGSYVAVPTWADKRPVLPSSDAQWGALIVIWGLVALYIFLRSLGELLKRCKGHFLWRFCVRIWKKRWAFKSLKAICVKLWKGRNENKSAAVNGRADTGEVHWNAWDPDINKDIISISKNRWELTHQYPHLKEHITGWGDQLHAGYTSVLAMILGSLIPGILHPKDYVTNPTLICVIGILFLAFFWSDMRKQVLEESLYHTSPSATDKVTYVNKAAKPGAGHDAEPREINIKIAERGFKSSGGRMEFLTEGYSSSREKDAPDEEALETTAHSSGA